MEMFKIKKSCLTEKSSIIVARALLLFLSGCMIPPDLGPKPDPRPDLISYKGNGESTFLYPKQDCWKQYNDPQLNQLIEEALSQSPTIAQAIARIQNANAHAVIAGASLLPSVTAEGKIGKYRQSYNNGAPPAFVPKGFQDTASATINFNYELDFWGKNSDTLEAASSDMEAAKLMLEQAKIILSTSIASMYANLAQYCAEFEVLKETVSVRAKTLELFEKRFKNGLENESSVEQAKSNYAAAQAEMAAMEETINLTRNALAALIGATPERALKIQNPKLENMVPVGIPEVIPADLISRRPDVIAAQLTLEADASRINVAKTGFYPNINMTAYVGHQSLGLKTFMKSGSLIGYFGPAIHLPLFQAGLVEGQYRGARADYDASLANYESTIIQALHEVADAITSHKSLNIRVLKTTAALRAAEKAYSLSKSRYNGGLSTYLEVLRAEDSLITTRRAMAQIQARAFTLDVALAKALGGGFKPILKSKE